MKYKVGMYGGSFDPLHVGHIHDIVKASSMCKELNIIISWCKERDSVSKELRYRWILNSVKHLSNVRIHLVEDNAASKELYDNDDYWQKGAKDIKKAIGKSIDVVFCGTDYLGTNRFEKLYSPESKIIYFDRSEIPVSSSQIRKNPYKYWDYIPGICKPYYVKKVFILGGESTGKSTLTQNLALAYNTNFVSEVGRDISDIAGGEDYMNADDLYEILIRHKVNILDNVKYSNKLLFIDTDALTTLFYAKFLLSENNEIMKCKNLAESIHNITNSDLVLFLEPTVEFVQDGTRNEIIASDREKYSQQIKKLLDKNNVKYYCLSGDYLDRFLSSKKLVDEMLEL